MTCNCCYAPCNKPIGLQPNYYYRKKYETYVMELETKAGKRLWGMSTACDNAARELYGHIVGRKSNIMCLVTTIEDADKLFEYFKTFANAWAYYVSSS